MATLLGSTVKDRITGIEGIVVAETNYLYGCTRIAIQPPGSHEGRPHESVHIDAPQAEVIQLGTIERVTEPTTGGDRPAPAPRPTPVR